MQPRFLIPSDIFFQIETLSKVNHKNFINLFGYCEEEDILLHFSSLQFLPVNVNKLAWFHCFMAF